MSKIANRIISELNEPKKGFMYRLIDMIGDDAALNLLQETQKLIAAGYDEAEANGPLLRKDGDRRTPGGTFIYLARGHMGWRQWRKLRAWKPRPRWPITFDIYRELQQLATGEASVEIEITGEPEKFSVKQGIVSVMFITEPDEAMIPEGLPLPPASSKYIVLMQQSDYEPVAAQLKEGAKLHVKGYCHINTKKGYGMVLAREVTAV